MAKKTAAKSAKKSAQQPLPSQARQIPPEAALGSLDRDLVLKWLAENVPKSRVQHTLRVEDLASDLAQRHQIDVEQTAQAALLHDLAKYFKPKRLLTMARTHDIPLDAVLEANPRLLHAEVSAIVAQQQFQVQEAAILDAIRHHTLGAPGMGAMSCIVFLADSLEPGRGDAADLNQIRTICKTNLLHGVALNCDRTLQQLLQQQRPIHPRMVQTRNWALHSLQKKSMG